LSKAGDSSSATIIDACCLLNLHAGGRLEDMLRDAGPSFHVVDYVLNEEARSLWTLAEAGNAPLKAAPAGAPPNHLQVVRVDTDEEAADLLSLVAVDRLGEGEARSVALAIHRGYAVATDDRRARAVIANRYPSISIVGTPELVYSWAKRTRATNAEVKEILRKIETVGRYVPGPRQPLFKWWQGMR